MKNIVKTVAVAAGAMLLAGVASAAGGTEIDQRPGGLSLHQAQKAHNPMVRYYKVPTVHFFFFPIGVEIQFRGDKTGGGSDLNLWSPGDISLYGEVVHDGGWFCAATQGTPLEQFAEIALRCPE
jgi:hypothetical protein